ncbi:MAG: PQQ-binding-like beta-propeller repeat protein [Sorangiineae bacterium]|nr:PQQ-binding-like beta-propeller repeat protein [Polyangiaceae bacterium]MEB2322873.1 PQQ-binding-like beta-propeller repeat protein [Sorangiineae bacterium]
MSDLQAFTCPTCGAPLTVPPEATQVTCPYCQGTHATPRRVAPPPPQQVVVQFGQSPMGAQDFQQLTVAATGRLRWLPLMFILPVLGTLAAVGASVFHAARSTGGGFSVPSLSGMVEATSFNDRPFLFDVNGDGVMDVIGKTSPRGKPDSGWIAAYDGTAGKELWRSSAITKEAADSMAVRLLAGDVFITVDALGKLQAYQAKNGQPAWAGLVTDQARSACAGDGFVRITTSDESAHDFSLASGQKLTDRAKAPCRPVHTSHDDGGPGYRILGWSEYERLGLPELHAIKGMSAHRALVLDGGKRAFMLGSRSPGTGVSMVAAVDGKKILWQTVVPGVDPLTTDVNVLTQIATFAGNKLFVPYNLKGNKGVRMVALDASTGSRLWDIEIHATTQVQTGVAATANEVYFASWTALYSFRADTGAKRFMIGHEF